MSSYRHPGRVEIAHRNVGFLELFRPVAHLTATREPAFDVRHVKRDEEIGPNGQTQTDPLSHIFP